MEHNINNRYYNICDNHRTNKIFLKYNLKQKGDEIKDHYAILRKDLVELSQSLTIIMNSSEYIPEWRNKIEILLIVVKLHEDLKYHLEK